MAELKLSAKERQALKGEAHRLNPVVLLGAEGLSEAVVRETDRALNAHGLIKVKVPGDDRELRARIFDDLATRLSAAKVQAIGKLLVLYRPLPAPPEPAEKRDASHRPPRAPARSPARPAQRSAGRAAAPRKPKKTASASR
jgi:putative YhbY family RNA-binding protein